MIIVPFQQVSQMHKVSTVAAKDTKNSWRTEGTHFGPKLAWSVQVEDIFGGRRNGTVSLPCTKKVRISALLKFSSHEHSMLLHDICMHSRLPWCDQQDSGTWRDLSHHRSHHSLYANIDGWPYPETSGACTTSKQDRHFYASNTNWWQRVITVSWTRLLTCIAWWRKIRKRIEINIKQEKFSWMAMIYHGSQ